MFSPKLRGSDLSRFELFADCSPAQLASVDSLSTRLHIGTGRVLLHEGGADRQFLIILEGEVGVSRHRARRLPCSHLVTSWARWPMLTGEPRSATVTALTPLEILVCNGGEFAALLDRVPSVKDKLVATAASRMTANALAA